MIDIIDASGNTSSFGALKVTESNI